MQVEEISLERVLRPPLDAALPCKPQGLCFAVAVLLHYFLLCVFCWMFVEGVNIHRGMVKVFRTADRMHIYCAIGWGRCQV